MRRGDLVTIVVSGDYGKPCPALVVQDDAFADLPSVTVLQLTSDVHEEHAIRITVEPDADNGLRKPSQIMVDLRGDGGDREGGSRLRQARSAHHGDGRCRDASLLRARDATGVVRDGRDQREACGPRGAVHRQGSFADEWKP